MLLFYQVLLESVIRYRMSAWNGNLSVRLNSKLPRLVQTAIKIMGRTENLSRQSTYEQSARRQAQKVPSDPPHILHSEYELLPSGSRSAEIPECKLNSFTESFVPALIKSLNNMSLGLYELYNITMVLIYSYIFIFSDFYPPSPTVLFFTGNGQYIFLCLHSYELLCTCGLYFCCIY